MSEQFIENEWYPFLETKKLKSSKPVKIQRFSKNYILWRTKNGKTVCQEDRCPHRGASLSMGKVIDDCIECPYHGAQFKADGSCTIMPSNGPDAAIPPKFKLQAMHVREAFDLIWVWYGKSEPGFEPYLPFSDDFGCVVEGKSITRSEYRECMRSIVFDSGFIRTMEAALDDTHFPFIHKMFTPPKGGPIADPYHCEVDGPFIKTWGRFRKEGPAQNNEGSPFMNFVRFPNMSLSDIPDLKFKAYIFLCPIDEAHTWIVIYSYQALVRLPILGGFVAWLYVMLITKVVWQQDLRMLRTQQPTTGGFGSDMLIAHADKAILEFWKLWRRALNSQRLSSNQAHFEGRSVAALESAIGNEIQIRPTTLEQTPHQL